jgi:glutamate-1-semialdehyde 2,1-aminomutase
MDHSQSAAVFSRNRRHIAGGCVSLNRLVSPEIAFVRGQGAYLWDADGNRYIDYHAAFAPYILGHADPDVDGAVITTLQGGATLSGSGTNPLEGQAAELLKACVPSLDLVQFLNTGSEAVYLACRLSRAFTGKDHLVVMQGGYNGWHDEVGCNVMTPLEVIGPRVSPGEYPYTPMSAGAADGVAERVHVVNYNDLDSVRWALKTFPVSAVLTEPVLQNIGVVPPKEGYLEGLRDLCDAFGALLIFDEVKTGFRHGLAGWQGRCGVTPDLTVFGKAIANGYPVGAVGGKRQVMELIGHPDPKKRVLVAGTYNGHPVAMSAAVATMTRLRADDGAVYSRIDQLGARLEDGMKRLYRKAGVEAVVSRQGGAFCTYFMDHIPTDWHDLAAHHDFERDLALRRAMIELGVYQIPLAAKQGSISAAHTEAEIDETLRVLEEILRRDTA